MNGLGAGCVPLKVASHRVKGCFRIMLTALWDSLTLLNHTTIIAGDIWGLLRTYIIEVPAKPDFYSSKIRILDMRHSVEKETTP